MEENSKHSENEEQESLDQKESFNDHETSQKFTQNEGSSTFSPEFKRNDNFKGKKDEDLLRNNRSAFQNFKHIPEPNEENNTPEKTKNPPKTRTNFTIQAKGDVKEKHRVPRKPSKKTEDFPDRKHSEIDGPSGAKTPNIHMKKSGFVFKQKPISRQTDPNENESQTKPESKEPIALRPFKGIPKNPSKPRLHEKQSTEEFPSKKEQEEKPGKAVIDEMTSTGIT